MPGENEDPNDGLDETIQEGEGQGDETVQPDEEAGDAGTGEGADEGEEGTEGQDGVGEGDEPPRRASRAQTRIQTLARETREANERATRVERELAELRAAQARERVAAQQETPEARAVRRATMAPEDIMREDLRESEGRMQALVNQQMVQNREREDRQAYREILRDNPALSKYDAEVERIRAEQQAVGNFVPREALLDLVIGRAARAAAKSKASGAKPAARRQAAPQRTEPARSRGDTAPARGRQGDSLEARLSDVPI